MQNPFHIHKWRQTQSEFFPATLAPATIEGHLSKDAQMLVFGYTIVTQACTCGAVVVKYFAGNVKTD